MARANRYNLPDTSLLPERLKELAPSNGLTLWKNLGRRNLKGYIGAMIKPFAHKGLEDFFYDGVKKGIQPKHANKIAAILDRLDATNDIRDMNYPGSRLHLLQPTKEGRWAVKVSGNWRITFRFEDGDAYEVNYEDYH